MFKRSFQVNKHQPPATAGGSDLSRHPLTLNLLYGFGETPAP
jgi:hypothetical protein